MPSAIGQPDLLRRLLEQLEMVKPIKAISITAMNNLFIVSLI